MYEPQFWFDLIVFVIVYYNLNSFRDTHDAFQVVIVWDGSYGGAYRIGGCLIFVWVVLSVFVDAFLLAFNMKYLG